ncbi:MAG: helix-turn-helix domain-containing protein [Bacteroidota bacterium]
MLQHQFLFFFSAVGVFNAILLCGYLFVGVRPKKTSQYLLAFLLLWFCFRVGVSCIYFFKKNLSPDWIQLGLSASFLIGPTLLAYVKLQVKEREQMTRWEQLQLFGSFLFILIFGLLYRYRDNYQMWDQVLRYYIHSQLTLYLVVISFRLIPIVKKKWLDQQELSHREWAVIVAFTTTLLICGGFVVSLYTSYVVGPVFTSFIFYVLVILGLFYQKQVRALFFSVEKYANKKIDDTEATQLLGELKHLMEEERLFENPLLKLEVLAQRLKISENRLSQLLNDNLGKSYAQFISEYRIEAAKQLLTSDSPLTIEAIGYEVGFNSKTSFYTTFKKQMGQTPASFKSN